MDFPTYVLFCLCQTSHLRDALPGTLPAALSTVSATLPAGLRIALHVHPVGFVVHVPHNASDAKRHAWQQWVLDDGTVLQGKERGNISSWVNGFPPGQWSKVQNVFLSYPKRKHGNMQRSCQVVRRESETFRCPC